MPGSSNKSQLRGFHQVEPPLFAKIIEGDIARDCALKSIKEIWSHPGTGPSPSPKPTGDKLYFPLLQIFLVLLLLKCIFRKRIQVRGKIM